MGGPQSCENPTGAPGETLGQREQEGAFAPEPLHQTARGDACLASDIRQSEFVRPAPAHRALSRCEHVFICDLLASSRHRQFDNF
jgi:hypothetical protein